MRKGHHAYSRHAAPAGALPTIAATPPPQSPRSAGAHGGGGWRRGAASLSDALLLAGTLWALLLTGYVARSVWRGSGGGSAALWEAPPGYAGEPVLISYSYFEKDPIQVTNFEFFLAAGTSSPPGNSDVRWSIVVSGDNCSPCQGLRSILPEPEPADLTGLGIREARHGERFTLLYRSENVGMDLGAHNATLEYFAYRGELGRYRYFFFLNSSVKGPFWPPWVPVGWHWTHAFLGRMGGAVHAVGSSLVCLPKADAGGPGPRLESWAFAVDKEGLEAALAGGVFLTRDCKLCNDGAGIVVGGEYGLTASQFAAGYNVATLMARYAAGTDWRDRGHWGCNDNVHPSRAGTYAGISFHPYETIFVKSSWHVADPYTRRYSQWSLQHLLGKAGTEGAFDEKLYRYAISEAAQRPRDLEEAYRPPVA